MPLSQFITQENIRFDGTLDSAVVIDTSSGVRSLILTDNLSAADQDILNAFIEARGGDLPQVNPTAGFSRIELQTAVSEDDSTELDQQLYKTNGYAELDLSGSDGSDPSGLQGSSPASQTVRFLPLIEGYQQAFGSPISSTSGYQDCEITGIDPDGPTGFTPGFEGFSLRVNGQARYHNIDKSLSTTFQQFVDQLNTALHDPSSYIGVPTVTVSITPTGLRFTSDEPGSHSSITIQYEHTTLFSSLTGYVGFLPPEQGTNGLPTTYSSIFTIGGFPYTVTVVDFVVEGPSVFRTRFDDVVEAITSQTPSGVSASIFNGSIVVENANTDGTISIAEGTLFPALVGYHEIDPVIPSGTTPASQTVRFSPLISDSDNYRAFVPPAGSTSGYHFCEITGIDPDGPTGFTPGFELFRAYGTNINIYTQIDKSLCTTFQQLVDQLNIVMQDHSLERGVPTATVSITPTGIRFTSEYTGIHSYVDVTYHASTLFTSLPGYVDFLPPESGTNGPPTLKSSIFTIDGFPYTVGMMDYSVEGSDIIEPRFNDVVEAITSQTPSGVSASIFNGNIVVENVNPGGTISIAEGTLFPALDGYDRIDPAVPAGTTPASRTYSAIIVVDGINRFPIAITPTSTATLGDIADQITELTDEHALEAYVGGGKLWIESSREGVGSTIRLFDTGALFSSLTGYNASTSPNYVDGLSPIEYTAIVVVDGVEIPLTVLSRNAETYDYLISEINDQLDGAALAQLVGSSIVITSTTTGPDSSVRIIDRNLFRSLGQFRRVSQSVRGIDDMLVAFTDSPISSIFNLVQVGVRPPAPVVPGRASLPRIPEWTYFGGTPAEWRFLADDSLVNS